MISDLRQAIRTLTASKGFSLLIVGVLAVGISANAAMFSIVNGVLLKPLPLADPQRLVSVETTVRGEPDNTSYPDFLDWRAQTSSFDALAVYASTGTTLTGVGEAKSFTSLVVSPELLSLLGVAPLRGRVFNADDDKPGARKSRHGTPRQTPPESALGRAAAARRCRPRRGGRTVDSPRR